MIPPIIMKDGCMSKWDKLIARILTIPRDLQFKELEKVLKKFGYTAIYPSGGSSHCQFRKAGKPTLTIPNHKTVKVVYVRMVKEIVEKELNK